MSIKQFIKRNSGYFPELYFALVKLKRMHDFKNEPHVKNLLTKETDIVIEGFPRSANTYAVVAFYMSQQTPKLVAHHYHAAGHVIKGIKFGKPVVVLIRKPEDAISSLCVRHPNISIERAIKDYVAFYKPLLKYKEKVVVAGFDEIRNDYSIVLQEVNSKFGTNFDIPIIDDDFQDKCFRRIENRNKHKSGGKITETMIARPSEKRNLLKDKIKKDIKNKKYRKRIEKAKEIYTKTIN